MILGQGPTAQHPIDFTPPAVGGGNIPSLPKTGFYSGNIWPLSMVRPPMHAYPAYQPKVNGGPRPMPPFGPVTAAASPAAAVAPAPSPTPAGTNGAFGGAGFGTTGGVQRHSHVDPYMVMRQGVIPGVSPSGSNIRAGVTNAGMRVQNSMPFQSAPLAMVSPTPAAPALPPMPAPSATHGFGRFSWNPINWFRKPGMAQAAATQAHMKGFGAHCEMVGPRLDGTRVLICNGRVMMVIDREGNVLRNAYSNPGYY